MDKGGGEYVQRVALVDMHDLPMYCPDITANTAALCSLRLHHGESGSQSAARRWDSAIFDHIGQVHLPIVGRSDVTT